MENNHWVEEILKDRSITLTGFADLSEIDTEIRLIPVRHMYCYCLTGISQHNKRTIQRIL